MNKRKLEVWQPFLFAIVMVIGMAIGFKLKEKTSGIVFFQNTKKTSLEEVINLVDTRYVDKVSADSLKTEVIDELLSKLDPHSVFIPADDLRSANEELIGNFEGIGVEFQMFDDTVNVLNVIKDGPSDRAGIKVGDKIIKVNDTLSLTGKDIEPSDVGKILRGPNNSRVKVTVMREGKLQGFTITRGYIPLPSVDVAYMINPGVGFIRINKFSNTTYEEFMQNLERLKGEGMKSLIVDVRGNSGGFLPEAVDIADEFLDDGKTIVYTKGNNVAEEVYKTKRAGLFEEGKLAILVDETSASASEILAGAVQDWDRGTIIGRRTFGKGLVQQQFNLSDGSGLRLTVARYYTPLGRNIQKPYNKAREQYEDELISRFHNGELLVGDTAKPAGKPYKTPGGRIVYGGGGITPDVFVPFDTTTQPQEVMELYYRGIIQRFAYKFYVNNRGLFKEYETPAELATKFEPGEAVWQAIMQQAKSDSVSISNIPSNAKKDLMERVKALLARQIWRAQGYFQVNNMKDPMVHKALEAVK